MKSEGYDYYCSPKEDDGLFIGEYLNGRKWKGKGKELYPEKSVYFEGEYDKGKKIKGKEFNEIGNLKFEGEYLDGKYYNGKGYNIYGGNTYEIKEGKNIPEDFYDFGFKYEGEYLKGEKNGKGKEYFKGKLIFEGDYLDGVKVEKGKNIMRMAL